MHSPEQQTRVPAQQKGTSLIYSAPGDTTLTTDTLSLYCEFMRSASSSKRVLKDNPPVVNGHGIGPPDYEG